MHNEYKYILNPAYFLRNDKKRSVIGTFDFPNISQDFYDKNTLNIIHPFHAQMLSFFNGERTLRECIDSISNYFDIKIDEVEAFIENYIENPKGITILYNSHYYFLPKNLLIENRNYTRSEVYQVEDFIINDELDVSSIRLFKPTKLIVETNLNCYTDCEYCYADRHNPRASELIPIERLFEIVDEARKLKIPSIELNGGEVLLHPRANDLLIYLDKNGYNPFISTKIPLTREKLLYLKSINFTRIQISIDTLDEAELCRRLRVKTGYLNKILHTMCDLDDLEFNWQVNIVLTTNNVNLQKHIEPLITKLISFKKLQSIKFAPVGFPMYKEKLLFEKIRPTISELDAIEKYIQKIDSLTDIELIYDIPTCTNAYRLPNIEDFKNRNRCVANQSGMVILPNGDVTICEELYWHPHFIIGNILHSSVDEIWNSEKARALFFINQEDLNPISGCAECKIFSECRHDKGVCWKMITMAYGMDNWDYPDPSCPLSNNYVRDFSY